jgi:CheY-like chemotaxis protein
VVAITAHALRDEEQKMKASGVDGVVTKPVRPEDVAAKFRRLLA